jgi:hypothetical protein
MLAAQRASRQNDSKPAAEEFAVPEAFTLIRDGESKSMAATISGGRVALDAATVEAELGWKLQPEGLCQGDVCIPVRDREALVSGQDIDLGALADALGQPLALDAEAGVGALGRSAADVCERMASLEAPDFSLPDLNGQLHTLSEHRGKKVLLIAYASW